MRDPALARALDAVLRAPAVPRRGLEPGARLRLVSASSLRRRNSSRRCSSSRALRSASCCRWRASASCSTRSSVVPFHLGSRIRRWLCSVWDRILVHVLRRVDALFTVCVTTSMLPPARSRVPMRPSIASLTFRTPSSSLRSRASRSGPSEAGVRGVLGDLGVFGWRVCWGDAQMSVSVYSESSAMLVVLCG